MIVKLDYVRITMILKGRYPDDATMTMIVTAREQRNPAGGVNADSIRPAA